MNKYYAPRESSVCVRAGAALSLSRRARSSLRFPFRRVSQSRSNGAQTSKGCESSLFLPLRINIPADEGDRKR